MMRPPVAFPTGEGHICARYEVVGRKITCLHGHVVDAASATTPDTRPAQPFHYDSARHRALLWVANRGIVFVDNRLQAADGGDLSERTFAALVALFNLRVLVATGGDVRLADSGRQLLVDFEAFVQAAEAARCAGNTAEHTALSGSEQ